MATKRLFGVVKGHREHITGHTGRLYSDSEVADLLNTVHEENEQLNEKLESVGEIIDNQIYAVKHTHKNCKRVGIAELKKLKKVLICNGIINGDVE